MKTTLFTALALAALSLTALAATKPDQTATVAIGGKNITVKYSSPAVNGRTGKIFTKDGLIGGDANYPVWRAGANNATVLHTDAALDLGGLNLAPGDYSLFVNIANPAAWELIVNKQTGQQGLDYDAKQDVGKVKMTMSKPPALVEQLIYTLTSAGGNKGVLKLSWENVAASVNFTTK